MNTTFDLLGLFLAVFSLPFVTASIGYLYRQMSTRNRWGLTTPKNLRIYLSEEITVAHGKDNIPTTAVGNAKALALIVRSLYRGWRSVGGDQKSGFKYVFVSQEWKSAVEAEDVDLICLGGPTGNKVTRRALQELEERGEIGDSIGLTQRPAKPGEEGSNIVLKGEVLDLERDSEEKIVADYGLIIRTNNPWDENHRLIIISGISTYGTFGAARFMVEEKKNFPREKNFVVVIKTKVEGQYSGKGEILWSASLRSS